MEEPRVGEWSTALFGYIKPDTHWTGNWDSFPDNIQMGFEIHPTPQPAGREKFSLRIKRRNVTTRAYLHLVPGLGIMVA